MDHGKYALSESAYFVFPRSGWAPRLAEVPPPRRVMMRAIIMVVATAAVLIDPTSVAFTQDAQTTAEIASNGTEIPLADCGAGAPRLGALAPPSPTQPPRPAPLSNMPAVSPRRRQELSQFADRPG